VPGLQKVSVPIAKIFINVERSSTKERLLIPPPPKKMGAIVSTAIFVPFFQPRSRNLHFKSLHAIFAYNFIVL
jgi:hypothetical protein